MNPRFLTVLLLTMGCGDRATSSPARPAPVSPAPTAAAYEVHEWGLLRALPGDVLAVGTFSPGRATVPMAVDKPLLYFHAAAPVSVEHVRVEAVGGTIHEHWPLTAAGKLPTAIDWANLQLVPGAAPCQAVFPGPDACKDLPPGEACESNQLAGMVSPQATCLASGAAQLPFLFYRSQTTTFTPPITTRRLPSGALQITNTGSSVIPGVMLRIHHTVGRGRVIAEQVTPPAPGASLELPAQIASQPQADRPVDKSVADGITAPGDSEPGRQGLRKTMAGLGLDDGEIAAFLRAWDATLFAASGDAVDEATATDDLTALASEGDEILYFLPEADCERVARLSFSPPPSRVRRALAIWQPVVAR